MLLQSQKNEKFYLTVEERIIYNESNLEVQPKEIGLKNKRKYVRSNASAQKKSCCAEKGVKAGFACAERLTYYPKSAKSPKKNRKIEEDTANTKNI